MALTVYQIPWAIRTDTVEPRNNPAVLQIHKDIKDIQRMPLFQDLTLNNDKRADNKIKYTYSHNRHMRNGYAEYAQPNILQERWWRELT